jgi:2-polyprenyl-3-methyl-5-hydroxy-6-metoxy-1,4-benzoquinol methylase
MNKRILLVPSVSRGNGSGHLVRCLSLARSLGPGAAVFVAESKNGSSWTAAELSLAYARELSGVSLVTELRADQSWSLIILDRRATPPDELSFWERLGPVLALDEGGPGRSLASYLVDILPRPPERKGARFRGEEPNKRELGFLDLPQNRREAPPREFRRVLVSFGGEDPAGLALVMARALVEEGLFKPEALTVVSGALRNGAPPLGLDGATILGPVQDLKEHLFRYDLVFTSFGLTAYEAAFAGCGVVLLNPSLYHAALAREAGFPEIGVYRPDMKALRYLLENPSETLARTVAVAPEERESLAAFITGLEVSGSRGCPRCRSFARQAVFRSEEKTYFRCDSCGILYLERFAPGREAPYKESYFFDEYRSQYGKTYLEDWPALTKMAEERLAIIEGIAGWSLGRAKGLSVFDVGCAYGPYLAAARAHGQEPYGLDMAEEAARYVRRELGIPAVSGSFLDPSVAASFGGPFDVLSMWYVIEHFADLDRALRSAAALVRPGGIFAFSTPSGEGVSARYSRSSFFEKSPADHFTVWEPSRIKGILKAYGFRVESIRITGHHPERFPCMIGRKSGWGNRLALRFFGFVSKALGLGDTFEVYALREPVASVAPRPWAKAKRARVAHQG